VIDLRTAINQALDEELARDDTVVLFGEDVAAAGGVFAVTGGLAEKHGADRVFDTPISELALAGAAFGSAVSGLRPVIEIMFGDFLALAMDSLVNQASKDTATVLWSLERTNRLVVVEEGPRTGGWAAEILATAAEEGLGDVDAIRRLTTADHPIPYSPPLEDAFLPGAEAIAAAIRAI
jgi:pyruvate/2-oxoglutarate/acetoin dehydrogenase E1 component